MEFIAVSSLEDSSGVALFEQVAKRVYAQDTVWAPASEMMWRQRFEELKAKKGAFVRPLVAIEKGEPVARCMPIFIDGCVDDHGLPQAWIGFFECLEGHFGAGAALLTHAEMLLRKTDAKSVVLSKADNQLAGILTAGFDLPHMIFTNHNPPHYRGLILSCGYEAGLSMVSLYFTREHTRAFKLKLPGLRTREFERNNLNAEIETFHYLQTKIFENRPGYIPRTYEEDRQLVEGFLPFLEDEFIVIAETSAGDPVGLLVCLPDVYQKLQGVAIDRARIISIGAIPGCVNKGIGALMGAHLMENLLRKENYLYLEGSWVRTDNLAPRLLARRFKAQPGREFQLFEKRLV